MSKKTKLTLIVAGSLLLLVIVIGIILAKSFPANTNKQNNDNNPPSLVKKEEFIKDLSEKEQIHHKIINSIDFFNTAVGEFEKVDVEEVEVGDVLLVKTEAKVPVDGTVIAGEGSINEASITGESIPVAKEKGLRSMQEQ